MILPAYQHPYPLEVQIDSLSAQIDAAQDTLDRMRRLNCPAGITHHYVRSIETRRHRLARLMAKVAKN